ncbi:MAG: copper-binding protein [Arenicellales bacterium]
MKLPVININKSMVRLALCLASSNAIAQQAMVLDPEQHPTSPESQKVFPERILPLDTKLSWTNRFNGDETFNEDEVLERVATTTSMKDMEQNGQSSNVDGVSHSMKMDGMGVIKQLKPDQGKVKIKHGPIERLGMPAMTMVFKVEDADQLAGLEKGQEVSFSVDNSSGGFVITNILAMPADSMTSSSETEARTTSGMDAQGEIKTIRVEQGKIKIEHGPIERLGMPAMTMMFKVENPELLNGLQKGNSVNFSIDNSSGGFVITDIKVAE